MKKILVYNTVEDLCNDELIKEIKEKNIKAEAEFCDRYNAKWTEYKLSSGLNERQRKSTTRLIPPGAVCINDQIHEKLLELYPTLGQGIELTYQIQLFAIGNKYYCSSEDSAPEKDNETILQLVEATQELIQEHNDYTAFFGSKVTPLLCTIIEEEPALDENRKIDTLRGLTEKEREEFEKLYWKEK